jgi:23S rRNA pseudouridine1911/1915/1917 synthase
MTADMPGEMIDVAVPQGLDGLRVDRALSMLTGLSRAEAQRVIDDGFVSVNGRVIAKASYVLEEGQHLLAVLPTPDDGFVEPEPDVAVEVLLEDPQFVVVNKSPELVVHPGAGQRRGTMIAGLLARYPEIAELSTQGICDPVRPGVVHRLDKGTSGVLVIARTAEAYYSLSDQLADRLMDRDYIGLVDGHVTENRGVVDAPLGRSSKVPTMMAVRGDGRPARTGYEVIERFEKPFATTLLRLQLETGRTHQIRVHLATIGHPVVNDSRYGHRRDKRLGEERFFLHSARLSFDHPTTGARVVTTAALPDDLVRLLPEGYSIDS